MKIAYVTHTRFPTEKANGVQIANVCHAMTRLGHEVTLLTPTVRNAIKDDPHAYYGLPRSFAVRKVDHFDALASPFIPGFFGFGLGMLFYRRALRRILEDQLRIHENRSERRNWYDHELEPGDARQRD